MTLTSSPGWTARPFADRDPASSGSTVEPRSSGGFEIARIEILAATTPPWVDMYIDRMSELRSHKVDEPDWDERGAQPLQREAMELGLRVLGALFGGAELPFPWIVPTVRGGLQFEWHAGGLDLELDIDPTGVVDAFFTDVAEGKEWDGSLTEREFDVVNALERMKLQSGLL